MPACIPPRSVINVKNEDNHCFEWAILSALYPADENAHRPAKYQAHQRELNFTGIKFPVKVTDISKFERQNPGLSVNIFGWKSGLYPLHVSKQAGREIDLLLLTDTKDPEKTHYVWIKNSKHKRCQHPCRHCLHIFSSDALLENHINDCQGIGKKPQRTVMPKEGQNILNFTNHHKQMHVPCIIYADFDLDCLHNPIEGCADNPEKKLHTTDRKAGAMQLLLCSGSQ